MEAVPVFDEDAHYRSLRAHYKAGTIGSGKGRAMYYHARSEHKKRKLAAGECLTSESDASCDERSDM